MSDNSTPNPETTAQPPSGGSVPAEEVKEPVKKTFVSLTDVDYEKRYVLMKREIENEKDPTAHLDAVEELMESLINGTCTVSNEHQGYFFCDALPAIVRLLTHRRFSRDDDQLLRTLDFFLRVIDLIIKFWPFDLMGLLESLNRIIDDNRPIYNGRMYDKEDLLYVRFQSEKQQQEGYVELKELAVLSPTMRASRFVVHSINYFVNKGGLELLVHRLHNAESRVSIPLLKLHLSIWNKMRMFLITELQARYFPALERTFDILRDLSEEELKQVKKEDVEEIIKNEETIMKTYKGMEAYQLSETFFLFFGLKCFKCSNLEKRMHGLSYIEEAIQMVGRKKTAMGWDHYESSTSGNSSMKSYAPARWLEAKHIIDFLQENQILSSVFQAKMSDMHPELVRRSKVILKFLADNRVLTTEDLNMLWKATQTPHAEAAVFEVLGAMCQHLDLEHQLYLLKLIQEVPFMNYTPRTITLLAQFHAQSYAANSYTEVRLKSLNVLWQLIQDDSVVEQSTVELALNQLSKLVNQYNLKPHRYALMKNWIDRIRKRQSVQQCIFLLQKLMSESYYDDNEYRHLKETESSRQKLLNDFKKTCRLVDLLFRELAEYKSEVKLKLEELEKDGQVIDRNNYIFVGRYPHLQAIQARLDFIRFTMDYSSARLTSIRADLLWETLVMGAITPEERERILTWFFRICNRFDKVDINTVSSKMAHHLFTERLCRLDFANITTTAFDCFKRYFCCVNSMCRSLKMDGPHDEHYFVQNFSELLGLDSLWEIVLRSKNEVVFSDSMHLLVDLHQRIGNRRMPQQVIPGVMGINEIRKNFVDKCMAHLQYYMNAVRKEEGDVIAHSSHIDRLITLLQTFLTEGKRRDEVAERENNQAIVGPLPEATTRAAAHGASQQGPPKAKSAYDRQNVEFLMSMMALPELEVTIALQKNNWHLDNTTVWLFEDTNKQQVIKEAAKWTNPAQEEAAPQPVEPPPKDIPSSRFLSDNQAYFDQLFDLLTFNHIKSEKAWEILTSLPVNPIIENTLSTLEGDGPQGCPKWDDLLNARSMYKTLYCLKIIDSLMGPADGAKEPISTKQNLWCRKFFHTGGFHHLLEILSQGKISGQTHSPAYKSCLRLLLKILYYFLRVGLGSVTNKELKKGKRMLALSMDTNTNLLEGIRFPEFLRVLIQLVANLSANPIKYRVDPANSEDDLAIVQDAISLLVASIEARPGLLTSFYNYSSFGQEGGDGQQNKKEKEKEGVHVGGGEGVKGIGGGIYERERGRIEEFIVNMVMNHPVRKIRKCVTNGLLRLCTAFATKSVESLGGEIPPHTFFLELLLAHMPPEGSTNLRCEQYFKFLNSLVSDYFSKSGDPAAAFAKFEGMLDAAVERIKRRPVIEETPTGQPDLVLVGELSIVCTIAAHNPSIKRKLAAPEGDDLINELWHKCLFPEPNKLLRRSKKLKWRENNKCKTKKSRAMCFKLLTELARGCKDNLFTVLHLLLPNHQTDTAEISTTWDAPAGKNDCGFVGLNNPGCICYMNALVQQIFMTPALRYGLMTARPTTNIDPGDNVVVQLQNMFGYLMHSEKQFYDPAETFCKAIKDRGGGSIDLHVQQDAEEFLRLLCERLEELLKGTEHEKLLNNFTGVESQILRCPNDPTHFSEREDPISVISIEIKGKANLTEALSFYVQGEQVEWKCEKCEKTVDAALKRISLKKLPNTLMIHLKRFDFNYDTMLRAKLSNYFDFPMDLDMEPYTTEGVARREALASRDAKRKEASARSGEGGGADKMADEDLMDDSDIEIPDLPHPPSYYEYELVGVLVHSGNAEAGHYYSYIKDRTKPGQQWFHFDDKFVKPWNLRELEEECFGGEQTVTHYGSSWPTKTPRLKNAYMLFYQRKVPEPEEFPLPEIIQRPTVALDKEARKQFLAEQQQLQLQPNEKGKEKETGDKALATVVVDDELSDEDDYFRAVFTDLVPDTVLEEVWQLNHRVTKQRHLFEAPYLAFMRDVLALVTIDKQVTEIQGPLESDFNFQIVKLATYFALDTLVKAKDQALEALYRSFVDIMLEIYTHHVPAARWFLTVLMDQHKKWLRYHLLDAIENQVRQGFATVVLAALTAVANTEHDIMVKERELRLPGIREKNNPELPLPTGERLVEDVEYTFISQAMSVQFVENLLSMSESTRSVSRKFHWYWWLLVKFAMIGHEERMFLVERGMIGILIDYYMGDFSPYKKHSGRAKIGDKQGDLNLNSFMDLLAICVAATETKGIKASGSRPPTCNPEDKELAWAPQKCMHLLSHKEAFASLLKQCYNASCNKVLVQHLCWEDEERSYWILQVILSSVKSNDSTLKGSVGYVLDSLYDMLELRDSLQQWRVTIALGNQTHGLLDIMDRTKQTPGQLLPICSFLHRCLVSNPVVTAYLFKVRDSFSWLEKHLQEPDATFIHMTTYNVDSPTDDIKDVYAKLKPFWDFGRPIQEEQQKEEGKGEEEREKEKEKDNEKGKEKETGEHVSAAAGMAEPMIVFATEWNDELDLIPRSFMQVYLN